MADDSQFMDVGSAAIVNQLKQMNLHLAGIHAVLSSIDNTLAQKNLKIK